MTRWKTRRQSCHWTRGGASHLQLRLAKSGIRRRQDHSSFVLCPCCSWASRWWRHAMVGGSSKKIWSTNPARATEQAGQAPYRRGRCVPQPRSAARARRRAVLVEAHDEGQTADRRYLGEATMARLTSPPPRQGVHLARPSAAIHADSATRCRRCCAPSPLGTSITDRATGEPRDMTQASSPQGSAPPRRASSLFTPLNLVHGSVSGRT